MRGFIMSLRPILFASRTRSMDEIFTVCADAAMEKSFDLRSPQNCLHQAMMLPCMPSSDDGVQDID